MTKVRLALNWFPDAQHGGFYAALVHGFYEEEGLDVEIIPGGPGVPIMQKVTLGRVDFAVSNADHILIGRKQQAPVVALMAPLQNSPRCILVHRRSGIETFEQLDNVTLALGPGRPFAEYIQRHAHLENAKIVSYAGGVNQFVADSNYAQQGYVFSEPLIAKRLGADASTLMVSDLGYNPYTSCLITHEDHVRDRSDMVSRFVRASRRGWQKYLQEAETTNLEINRVNPEMDLESLRYAVERLRPLCLPDGMASESLGIMSASRWQTLVDQLKSIDFLPADFQVGQAYTDQFLTEPIEKPSSPQETSSTGGATSPAGG